MGQTYFDNSSDVKPAAFAYRAEVTGASGSQTEVDGYVWDLSGSDSDDVPRTDTIDDDTYLDLEGISGEVTIVCAMGGAEGTVRIHEAVTASHITDADADLTTTDTTVAADTTDLVFGSLVGGTTYLRITADQDCVVYVGGSA